MKASEKIGLMKSNKALLRKIQKGEFDKAPEGDDPLGLEKWMVKKMKKAVIMVLGSAATKLMKKLNSEQEIMLNVSDMIIQTYAAESTILRTEKLMLSKGKDKIVHQMSMARVFLHEAVNVLNNKGQEAVLAFTEG